MCTTRCAVSPGTRFVMFTRSPAFGLSFEIRSVAVAKVLPGLIVIAVNVAVVEPADEVMPIKTRAESAIVARRNFAPRILVPHFFRLDPPVPVDGGTISSNGPCGIGPQGGTHLAHWDYDHRGCSGGHRGTTTCELLALLRELLTEGRSTARPRLGYGDTLLAPGPRAPPEHGGRREADETGRREHDRLAGRDRDPDEHEELDLEEQHEEREGERRGPIGPPAAVGERDVDEAAHAAAILEEGGGALGSNADHSDRRPHRLRDAIEIGGGLRRQGPTLRHAGDRRRPALERLVARTGSFQHERSRHVGGALPVELVARAERNPLVHVEDVELGDCELGERVEP